MTEAQITGPEASEEPHKRTYYVDLEGVGVKEWDQPTITVPEIRGLAGWDDLQPVIEVDLETNTEITVSENAIVELKPGKGFAKKVKFNRG